MSSYLKSEPLSNVATSTSSFLVVRLSDVGRVLLYFSYVRLCLL